MKKIYLLAFIIISCLGNSQTAMSFSATPDSANQSNRPGSTGTWSISYNGGIVTNSFYYSICCSNSISSALKLYRFNFNIPITATITGIAATYSTTGGNGGPTNYKWDSICIANNYIKTGNYKRDSINGSGGTYNHGNAADIWGAPLTPAIVNNPHFGLNFHIDTWGINTTIVGGFKMTVYYNVPSGINETINDLSAQVYCYDNILYVKENNSVRSTMELYNTAGQKVMGSVLENSATTLELSGLREGIYFYTLSSEKGIKRGKVIVK